MPAVQRRFWHIEFGELVTVEHDRAWLERTVAKLNYQPGAVWQGLLEEPVALVQPVALPPTDPDAYASTGTQFAGMSFQRYATSIERYDDNYFDVVLIDGRARPSCFKHAVPKTKIGGYIVLDNAEREEYAFIERAAHLSGFEITEFWGPGPFNRYFWRTIFVRKTNRDARRPAGPRAEVPQSATEHATATCSLSVATSATTAPAPIVQA